MDTLPSSEFRKVYASLTDETEVTVNGHVIGRWRPVNAPVRQITRGPHLVTDEDVVDLNLGTPEQQATAAQRIEQGKAGTTIIDDRFNSHPFTPVPKHK